jgi:hypothetical protein
MMTEVSGRTFGVRPAGRRKVAASVRIPQNDLVITRHSGASSHTQIRHLKF